MMPPKSSSTDPWSSLEHPAQEPLGPPEAFEPPVDMIEHNELLASALKAAPAYLYDRYTHYGDLGVLGWCKDFGELVDEIRACGLQGGLFTSTRDDGLEACDQILCLGLDVKLQFILLYLSSQVGRLRRFLDGEADSDGEGEARTEACT